MSSSIAEPIHGVPPSDEDLAVTRRAFLNWLIGAGAAATGAFALMTLARFIEPPARDISGNTELGWIEIGPAAQFNDQPKQVYYGDETIFVYRLKGELVAFSGVCPHVRCVISWFPDEDVYHCPCHASAFAKDGRKLYGPAPRGLYAQNMRLEKGMLWLGGGTPA